MQDLNQALSTLFESATWPSDRSPNHIWFLSSNINYTNCHLSTERDAKLTRCEPASRLPFEAIDSSIRLGSGFTTSPFGVAPTTLAQLGSPSTQLLKSWAWVGIQYRCQSTCWVTEHKLTGNPCLPGCLRILSSIQLRQSALVICRLSR